MVPDMDCLWESDRSAETDAYEVLGADSRIVPWQQTITEHVEEPKALLLRRVDEDSRHDDVHGLAVAQLGILPAVCGQDPSQSLDALRILVAGVFRQGPIQVLLDFFRRCARLSLVGLEERLVLALVRETHIDAARRQLPDLAAKPIGQSNLDEPEELRISHEREVAAMNCQKRAISLQAHRSKGQSTLTSKVVSPKLHL